ncbi:MAG TPA: type II toxin-antitoxin system VapC family toxin [Terriglobales bacterium]
MIVLDTNVLSAVMRATPEAAVVRWLDNQPEDSIWITSITALEVRFGIQLLPRGRKRAALSQAFDSFLESIRNRIAAFDYDAAEHAAALMARRKQVGRPVELRDTMIAGIVLARHATLATRNTAHSQDTGIALVDPWRET